MIHQLEIDSVILEFGSKRVLQDVYLICETGKITGLLGRNGSGKTCLMNIIYGQLRPENHSVRIDGKVLSKKPRKPYQIMYLPQFAYIPKSLSLKRIFQDFRLNYDEFVIEFPEFEKYRHVKLNRLSGGEQRIIEVYLLLVSKTNFCLLDEPFSQIMPIHVDTIKRLIVREKQNKGILLTDHLYEHIVDICDSLYVINSGKTHLTKNVHELETLGYVRSDN